MRIFVSYSQKDKAIVNDICDRLKLDGHEVWLDTFRISPGDSISRKIEEGIAEADVFLVIISKNSLRSEWVQKEFSAIALQQISKRQQRIIPVRIDSCSVPNYLADRAYLDLSKNFDAGLNQLSDTLKARSLDEVSPQPIRPPTSPEKRDGHISRLRESLRDGRLTVMCGAGVSVGARIPAWGKLLQQLLGALMEKLSKSHDLDLGRKSAAEFQHRYTTSSLILGKYLKNTLGPEFGRETRSALYSGEPTSCPLIDSIVDLSRPRRDGKALDSIITFNFDGLIEEQLDKNHIPNKPIFSEAIMHDPNQLPIYHVHGYLPRTGNIPDDADLVFSEDSYHSQFIEAFSWSNLIQLNKLTQNTCLFVGISLTDPNMRRLLDVAWRKNADKSIRHFILKKAPTFAEGDMLAKVSLLLEEQDANALGLNVIWTGDYDEMPEILRLIATPL